MTSSEFAQQAVDALRAVVSDQWTPGSLRLRSMLVERIWQGAGEYELEADVQSVEVKPLAALIDDVREESVDLVAYTVALGMRVPGIKADTDHLIDLAVQTMTTLDRIERQVTGTD